MSSVAIGGSAGQNTQSMYAVAIGASAGNMTQGMGAVAVGWFAGQSTQGATSIAIGSTAGQFKQGASAIAIGDSAGINTQGVYSIALGYHAGYAGQGDNSIAIGRYAGRTGQAQNSIVISASAVDVNGTEMGALYITPLRAQDGAPFKVLLYNETTYEVAYSDSAKTFVIDHPVDENKLLVHACLEGPEAGVYYRGKGEVVNGSSVVIELPSYVGSLCTFGTDLTVQITHIYDGKVKVFSASEVDVENNTFTVYGENGRFNWLVHGKRGDILVEPAKDSTIVKGDGPYKYI
jgi:hypothetical protein